jgi:hypothetical protein
MQDESFFSLGHLAGAVVGVQPSLDGQDILVRHTDFGQRLACLLGIAKAEIVRREDGFYYRIPHDRQVDDLLVELIDVLSSIRYAHPAMVQLEMVLEPAEP